MRDKAFFADAIDPERALFEFFSTLKPDWERRCDAIANGPPEHLPLLLISQLPRSGGSLLAQLLDGHPQLNTYPGEMRIGYPSKTIWPRLNPNDRPAQLFAKLFHSELGTFAAKGYKKPGKAKEKHVALPFRYSPPDHFDQFARSLAELQSELAASQHFLGRLGRLITRRGSTRPVLDCYFTSLFRAWPDGRASSPRYVAAFTPSLGAKRANASAFFRDYPDGRLISIMRDPGDWFVSRRAHTKKGNVRYGDLGQELAEWNAMAENVLQYRRDYGESFLLLSFKDLVTDREGTMRRLCAWCSIDFHPALSQQTFGGLAISANSNFMEKDDQLPAAVLQRKFQLNADEQSQVRLLTASLQAKLADIGCRL